MYHDANKHFKDFVSFFWRVHLDFFLGSCVGCTGMWLVVGAEVMEEVQRHGIWHWSFAPASWCLYIYLIEYIYIYTHTIGRMIVLRLSTDFVLGCIMTYSVCKTWPIYYMWCDSLVCGTIHFWWQKVMYEGVCVACHITSFTCNTTHSYSKWLIHTWCDYKNSIWKWVWVVSFRLISRWNYLLKCGMSHS